jgi:hypothetical protein
MGIIAAIAGIVGGLCAILGILNAADIFTQDLGMITMGWQFWMTLAAVLLLGCIAMLLGRNNNVTD